MDNSNIKWNKVGGDVKPEHNKNYLVTIRKEWSNDRIVTVGSYAYNPMSERYSWLHGRKTIAFAELPEPYIL